MTISITFELYNFNLELMSKENYSLEPERIEFYARCYFAEHHNACILRVWHKDDLITRYFR